MKYELPEDLKLHYFLCEKTQNVVTYRSCKRRCPDTYRTCWEQRLREDLARDCAIENEYNAKEFVTCSKCGSACDIGLMLNRFLCDNCGNVEYCDSDTQKLLMGSAYTEIDEQELFDVLKRIK